MLIVAPVMIAVTGMAGNGRRICMIECILPDIPNIKAHWDHPGVDPVPYLMVPMSDGSTLRFNAEIKHPGYVKAIQNIQNMKTGYPNGGHTSRTNDNLRFYKE